MIVKRLDRSALQQLSAMDEKAIRKLVHLGSQNSQIGHRRLYPITLLRSKLGRIADADAVTCARSQNSKDNKLIYNIRNPRPGYLHPGKFGAFDEDVRYGLPTARRLGFDTNSSPHFLKQGNKSGPAFIHS